MNFLKKLIIKQPSTKRSEIPSMKQTRKNAPLRESIPKFEERLKVQMDILQDMIDLLNKHEEVSLDIILKKAMVVLKTSIGEYTRLLEQILSARGITEKAPRIAGVGDAVQLMVRELNFYGGEGVLQAAEYLQKTGNTYLAGINEFIFLEHLKAVRKDFRIVGVFISKN